jgi:Mg-chelatase subunit ChlD
MKDKLLVIGLSLLALSASAVNIVTAQETFRIQRGGAAPVAPSYSNPASNDDPAFPAAAPGFHSSEGAIQGGVQRSDMQGSAEEGNLSPQRASTGQHTIVGGVQQNDMQAFADQASSPLRPMLGAAQGNNLRGQADVASQHPLSGGVTQLEIKNLARHDVVLVIDKSGSMSTPDCPGVGSGAGLASLGLGSSGSSSLLRMLAAFGGVSLGGMGGGGFGGMSRWEWCGAQTAALAQQYETVAPNGLSVVLFSTGTKIFPNVKVQEIPHIFSEYRPGGITNAATAVRQTLEDYFNRRNMTNGNVKPLLVAMITDGEPTNKGALVQVIAQAMTQIRRPDEIKITILQVGNDLDGSDFVEGLQRQFPIVSSKTFLQLQRTGLIRSLVDCISEHQPRQY